MGRRRLRHLNVLKPEAQLVVYDLRQDRMDEVSKTLSVEQLKALPRESAGLTALFICVPPGEHQFYMDWALSGNISFMVEQPVSHVIGRLSELQQQVQEKQITVHVSNNHRYSGRLLALRELVERGSLGKPLTGIVAIGEYLPDWHTYEPYQDYYPSSLEMGGGLDAVCDVDWLRYLFGDVVIGVCLADHVSDLEIDTCDVAQFILRFENGAQISLHTDMLDHAYQESLRLVFSEGTVVHREPEPFLRVYYKASKTWEQIALNEDVTGFPSMQGKENFNFVEPMYMRDCKVFLDRLDANDCSLDSLISGIKNINLVHNLMTIGATNRPLVEK